MVAWGVGSGPADSPALAVRVGLDAQVRGGGGHWRGEQCLH